MKKKLKLTPEPADIKFVSAETEELIKLAKGKFYWKGKEVKDVNKIYERFSQWMNGVDGIKNKSN